MKYGFRDSDIIAGSIAVTEDTDSHLVHDVKANEYKIFIAFYFFLAVNIHYIINIFSFFCDKIVL
ncbi:hypothetical protein BIY37_12090 [Candidatus Brocadia sapporoensis]|uniref:Uncharacterized protein n=1 Tax=Candidatus Brocadia sapporoensis TaxID=392547 RepID=A0A1V6LX77_9BACT|nr:hypothetical protein BIY37_12090 [Candidatus Brocadia sapporoensis]